MVDTPCKEDHLGTVHTSPSPLKFHHWVDRHQLMYKTELSALRAWRLWWQEVPNSREVFPSYEKVRQSASNTPWKPNFMTKSQVRLSKQGKNFCDCYNELITLRVLHKPKKNPRFFFFDIFREQTEIKSYPGMAAFVLEIMRYSSIPIHLHLQSPQSTQFQAFKNQLLYRTRSGSTVKPNSNLTISWESSKYP